jgi:RHS repeat-associated protein
LENLLAEADGSNTIQTMYTNEPEQYGNLVSSRIAGTTFYDHFDAIGSTRQVTNATGATTDSVIYDAWGNVVNRTGTSEVQLLWIGEMGYYFDVERGTCWVRERGVDPEIARWVSQDPFGFEDGPNRFLYVGNRPIQISDPNGMCQVCSGPVVQYRVLIADLDRFTKHQAYRKLADYTQRVWNSKNAARGFDVPELNTAGPVSLTNKANTEQLAFFLFFVSWDVCQKDGVCHLRIDETGSTVTIFDDKGNVVSPPGVVKGLPDRDATPKTNATRAKLEYDSVIDDRNPPLGVCDKILIFSDAPGGRVISRKQRLDVVIKQTLRVMDTKNENTLSTISHEVKVNIALDGSTSFSP